jgi:hypothetical protein
MTQADDIKTLRDASAALADIADRISCGGPKPDFTIARQVAVNRFNASPIWKKLKGTPWENDAPTIAAELMCMYAAECRVGASLMAGEGEKALSMSNAEIVAAAERGELPIYTPSSGEFERGWNAALDAALDFVGLPAGFSYQDTWTNEQLERLLVGFGDRVRALRKPAQEEGK